MRRAGAIPARFSLPTSQLVFSSEIRHPLLAKGHGFLAVFHFQVHFQQQSRSFLRRSGISVQVLPEPCPQLYPPNMVVKRLHAGISHLADLWIVTGHGPELLQGTPLALIVRHAQVGDDANQGGGFLF